MNFLFFFGICSTPKLSKYIILLPFTYKTIQWVPTDLNSSRFITYALSFVLGKLFLPNSSRDLTIFMISLIFSLEVIKVAVPDPNSVLWIAASVVDAAPVTLNGIKTLLANGLRKFLLKAIQFLVMVLKVYIKILLIVLFYAIEFW